MQKLILGKEEEIKENYFAARDIYIQAMSINCYEGAYHLGKLYLEKDKPLYDFNEGVRLLELAKSNSVKYADIDLALALISAPLYEDRIRGLKMIENREDMEATMEAICKKTVTIFENDELFVNYLIEACLRGDRICSYYAVENLKSLKKIDKLKFCLENILERDRSNAHYSGLYGELCFDLGDKERAKQYLLQATKTDSVKCLLGELYYGESGVLNKKISHSYLIQIGDLKVRNGVGAYLIAEMLKAYPLYFESTNSMILKYYEIAFESGCRKAAIGYTEFGKQIQKTKDILISLNSIDAAFQVVLFTEQKNRIDLFEEMVHKYSYMPAAMELTLIYGAPGCTSEQLQRARKFVDRIIESKNGMVQFNLYKVYDMSFKDKIDCRLFIQSKRFELCKRAYINGCTAAVVNYANSHYHGEGCEKSYEKFYTILLESFKEGEISLNVFLKSTKKLDSVRSDRWDLLNRTVGENAGREKYFQHFDPKFIEENLKK